MTEHRWIETDREDVRLRALGVEDAASLHVVITDNRAHLTARGDYGDLVALDAEGVCEMLTREDVAGFLFGIFESGDLSGVVSLVPVDPPRYGCGYWLARSATGRGLATTSLQALLEHARDTMGATDVFAGITHGNGPSENVVRRAGLAPIESFPTYTRFHIDLTRASASPSATEH